MIIIWAPHDKTNKMAFAPSLIRVFAVHMKKAWILSYPLSAQRRLWSAWASPPVFAGRTVILLVLSWGGSFVSLLIISTHYGVCEANAPINVFPWKGCSGNTLGIRLTKNHFPREVDRTPLHRNGILYTFILKFLKKCVSGVFSLTSN